MLGLGFGGPMWPSLAFQSYLPAWISFWLIWLGIVRTKALSFTVHCGRGFLDWSDDQCLFYLLAFLGLTAFNIKQKRWARGFINCWQLSLVFTRLFIQLAISPFWIRLLRIYAINQVTYVFNALNFSNGQTFSNAIYYGLLALAFGLVSAFLMSFTKQSSSARRIFRFMGWVAW